MLQRSYNLAIETSGRLGSVSLGRGDQLLASAAMPPQQRHTLDLMPTIDRLCRAHQVRPGDLAELYLSTGPGSFTGLRIGVTTAKMLAQVVGVKLVAVPTLDVVAQNAPADEGIAHLAACLNLKAGTVYAGLYQPGAGGYVRASEPALLSMTELLARFPRPLAMLPPEASLELPPGPHEQLRLLPAALAQARSEVVWQLGRAAAKRGAFVDPLELLPLYVRPVEAEELWKKRREKL